MCGIAGILNTGPVEADRALIEKMNSVLKHRGPDDAGVFTEGPVGLGMRRLAIIDLSRNAHQPMANEDETVWIVFNGEVYNHAALRSELESKGHTYRSRADTESILHLYEEAGIDCIHRLNGMFAFALWDADRKKLYLVRDRLGIKPLYYARVDGHLSFASEIKAILCDPSVSREIDFQAMDQYFSYGSIPHPRTIYKNISALEPGHILEVDNATVRKRQYWNLAEKVAGNADKAPRYSREDECLDEITLRLKKAVSARLMSDVSLGVFLSGGIDSSLVTALMGSSSRRPVKTFSVGFEDGGSHTNELQYARLVSERYATDHHEFVQTSDIGAVLPGVIRQFDEPFANPTAIPMYHIARLARGQITVALSGVGGDELFGGYPRHVASTWFKYHRIMPERLRRAGVSFIDTMKKAPDAYAMSDRLRRFLSLERGTDAFMYEAVRSISHGGCKHQLYEGPVKEALERGTYEESRFIESAFNQTRDRTLIDRALYADIISYLPTDLLTYCDRMSMATSLELRVPFCDHEFVEFAMSIPSQRKIRRFQLKYLMKKAAERLLPKEVIYRTKQGFSVPIGYWLKGDLQPLMNEFLSEGIMKRQRYFNVAAVRKMVKEHQSGRVNHASRIWSLLVFQMWHEAFMERAI